jgi:hypothetical protein
VPACARAAPRTLSGFGNGLSDLTSLDCALRSFPEVACGVCSARAFPQLAAWAGEETASARRADRFDGMPASRIL